MTALSRLAATTTSWRPAWGVSGMTNTMSRVMASRDGATEMDWLTGDWDALDAELEMREAELADYGDDDEEDDE